MKISLILTSLLFALPLCALAQTGMPVMRGVDPNTAKAGDTVIVEGVDLGADVVAEVYLTDGKADLKLEILEQTSTTVKVKVPSTAKPGRFALMVLTKAAEPKLIEQPLKIVIEQDTGTR